MNNKGFIATSLIYSFFLIFITLFLTIIADYLQNKLLLNSIESGIKDTLNNTKGIEDFEIGDIIDIQNGDNDVYELKAKSNWIIANIKYDIKTTTIDESEIVFYNLEPNENIPNDSQVTIDKIKEDLSYSSNLNGTYVNKLISASYEDYILPDSSDPNIFLSCSKISLTDTINIDNTECTGKTDPTKYRERKVISGWNDRKVLINPDGKGGFTIIGEA